jgi:hypothetical protein
MVTSGVGNQGWTTELLAGNLRLRKRRLLASRARVSPISDVKHVEPPGERVAYREAGQGPADESISQGLNDDRN